MRAEYAKRTRSILIFMLCEEGLMYSFLGIWNAVKWMWNVESWDSVFCSFRHFESSIHQIIPDLGGQWTLGPAYSWNCILSSSTAWIRKLHAPKGMIDKLSPFTRVIRVKQNNIKFNISLLCCTNTYHKLKHILLYIFFLPFQVIKKICLQFIEHHVIF